MAARTTTFDRYADSPAEIYERHLVPAFGSPCAAPVVDAAAISPGARVLDVACGTGVATRMAAERTGSGGSVHGVDADPGMVVVARAAPVNDPSIEWHRASAQDLPFERSSFDAVLCSLGLQLFADRPGALAEMHRVLAPGGRLAIGVPGPMPPLFGALRDLLDSQIGPSAAAFVPAVFSLDDPDALQHLLQDAGLAEIAVDRRTIPLHLAPPAAFLWQYLRGTPLAAALAPLDEDELVALEDAAVERFAPFSTGAGMDVEVGLLLATATGARGDDG